MSNDLNKIKIGLVEDHEVVRNAISKMLADIPQFEFVFDAANGQDFLDQLKDNPIDVVLLDLEMPVLNGIETIKELKSQGFSVKVVMLTMHDDLEIAFDLLSKGVDAYLLKECSTKEMIEAIITVHENGNYTNQFMNNAIIHSVASTRKTQNRMKQLDINERELRVLRLICDGHTSQEIADTILTSKKNLDLIRTKLMKKFKVKSANELIRASIINGLYTPRSNEEIKMEQENENMLKKLRKEKTLNQNYYHN